MEGERFVRYQGRNLYLELSWPGQICHSWSLESGQGAKETAGQAGLVRVAQELSVEVLVPRQGQALALSNLVKCLVQDVHIRVGHTTDTIVTVPLVLKSSVTIVSVV